MLYVADADARQVVWVELPGGRIARRVKVPSEPTGLAIIPGQPTLAVTCAASQSTVLLLDTNSGKTIASIPAGHSAMAPVITPDGKRLFVCNRFHDNVSVIDLATAMEVARVPAVREPIATAVTPDGRTVLVANHLPLARTDPAFRGNVSPIITVIDTQTLATSAIELTHGSTDLRGICVTPDGKYAFVAHLLSNFEAVPFRIEGGWINVNVISVIDLAQRKAMHTVGLDGYEYAAGNPWGIACTADGNSICVSLAGTHQLCVVDRSEATSQWAKSLSPMMGVWPIYPSLGDSPWRRVNLPGRAPRALAIAGSKIYVVQYFSDSVAVVDLRASSNDPVPAIALGPAPQPDEVRQGEMLFHDATICYQHWQSCASCHPDGRVDSLNWDLLNDGEGNSKNTKSMLLAHRTPPSMAEGIRMSAEGAVRSGVSTILFSQRPEEESAAIDAYLKSLRPVPSPHLVGGRLSVAAERGQKLFHSDAIGCNRCHPSPLYTDLKKHNVASRNSTDRVNRFDTPTLVEAWRTAPYLHDGRYTTVTKLLAEGRHGLGNKPDLSAQQIDDLVEFVLSL
jgi:YVTN family beta-propeller protein